MQNPSNATQGAERKNQKILESSLTQHPATAQPPEVFTSNVAPCPSCGTTQEKQIPGTGLHYAGLRCEDCERFIKWLPKPKNEGGAR